MTGIHSTGERENNHSVNYTLQTLTNGLAILLLFSSRSRSLTQPQICELTGFGKSRAFKLVTTLCASGFLRGLPDRPGYELGPSLAELGVLATEQMSIPRRAIPYLQQIVDATQETALLTMRRGEYSICISKVDSPHSIRMAAEVGLRCLINAGGSNVPLLAYAPTEIQQRYLSGEIALKRFTARTPITEGEIRSMIDGIRSRGYYVSKSEVEPGVMAVGAPIVLGDGKADFAISVAGPESRMSQNEPDIVAVVLGAARSLSSPDTAL